ncbi:inactive rhomboid protein 1-like [Saccoglossus kowalevskii]|uniref:Inactive rhomboid protein 1-like n=1 Tax=Saccoglossus kowalevskii TaxID=10224 RepID=A0ABM0M8L1_SACKO|nr:PREDICTED: inactive rhomboid protein 1-like [Saccoglossus kowalevskii]
MNVYTTALPPHNKTCMDMCERISKGTAGFFGVGANCDEDQKKWQQRRCRGRSFRRFKKDVVEDIQTRRMEQELEGIPQIVDPLARGRAFRFPPGSDEVDAPRQLRPTLSTATATSSIVRRQVTRAQQRGKRESVAKLGWKTLGTVVGKMTGAPRRGTISQSTHTQRKPPGLHSRSFAPSTLIDEDSDFDDELDTSFFTGHVLSPSSESLYDEVFFDFSPKTPRRAMPTIEEKALESEMTASSHFQKTLEKPEKPGLDEIDATAQPPPAYDEVIRPKEVEYLQMVPTGFGWKKKAADKRFEVAPTAPEKPIRRNKIDLDKILDAAFDNSDRHEFGKGLVGEWLHTSYKTQRMDTMVEEQLEKLEADHRPYFTYWITFVHVLITIMAIGVYGFAPVGFTLREQSDLILMSNLAVESVGFYEPENFWLGPRSADLIHLGAKYSPCMHTDARVLQAILNDKEYENTTGCCIKNDKAGCVQTTQAFCSETFAVFEKWSDTNPGPQGRTSGAVCGQDPRACTTPASVLPHEWPDDITKWPICRKTAQSSLDHMKCEMSGHPCCVGIQGECQIHTREYCDFVSGFFHEEATLCSQVDCIDNICGLIRPRHPKYPDQFYRLWLSLFLHAGLLHLALTVVFQMTILRDLEKLAGWLRISLIYMMSGVAGNLLSAIFIPYRAEVGPAASLFGILACLIVEVLQSWQLLEKPGIALLKLLGIVGVLLILGLLPWIDNFAAIGGFCSGILLAFTFLPYIYFGEFDKTRKRIQIGVCLGLYILLMILGYMVFYLYPVLDCSWCYYFNCIPFTDNFCDNMEMKLKPRQYELV